MLCVKVHPEIHMCIICHKYVFVIFLFVVQNDSYFVMEK